MVSAIQIINETRVPIDFYAGKEKGSYPSPNDWDTLPGGRRVTVPVWGEFVTLRWEDEGKKYSERVYKDSVYYGRTVVIYQEGSFPFFLRRYEKLTFPDDEPMVLYSM